MHSLRSHSSRRRDAPRSLAGSSWCARGVARWAWGHRPARRL